MNDKESCVGLLAEILRKIDNLPSGPFWNRDGLEGRYPFPIRLDLGNEQVIYITPEISKKLDRFSKIVMDVFFSSRKS